MARILVIEDEPDVAGVLVTLLEVNGHTAIWASEGVVGLRMARREKPDLILLDVMLPTVSGYDLCQLLRQDKRTADAKIIMVTGLGRGADVDKAFANGADDYLIKPFDRARLNMKINKQLGLP